MDLHIRFSIREIFSFFFLVSADSSRRRGLMFEGEIGCNMGALGGLPRSSCAELQDL